MKMAPRSSFWLASRSMNSGAPASRALPDTLSAGTISSASLPRVLNSCLVNSFLLYELLLFFSF